MTTGHAFSPRCAGARCVQDAVCSGLSCCQRQRRGHSPRAPLRAPRPAPLVHVISLQVRPNLGPQRTIATAEHGRCAPRSKRRRTARDNQLSKQPDGENDRHAPVCMPAVLALTVQHMHKLYAGFMREAALDEAHTNGVGNTDRQRLYGVGPCTTATTATRTSAPACASSARCARTSTCAWSASGVVTDICALTVPSDAAATLLTMVHVVARLTVPFTSNTTACCHQCSSESLADIHRRSSRCRVRCTHCRTAIGMNGAFIIAALAWRSHHTSGTTRTASLTTCRSRCSTRRGGCAPIQPCSE